MSPAILPVLLCLSLCPLALSRADEASANDVESATRRAVDLVTRAGSNWMKNKKCFSCHHQTLPMLGAIEASRAGFAVDPAWLKLQADNAHTYFEERIGDMDEGEHVPGGAATAGYGLWALSLDQRAPDPTTTAIVNYLLQIQGVQKLKDRKTRAEGTPLDGRWIASCRRAPLQGSEIGDTVLVLIGLEKYATPEQRPRVAAARAAAEAWVAGAKLKNQQDRVWRLWGLHRLDGDADAKAAVHTAILKAQRPDGGWPQTDDQESDAYSTAQTLFMLCQTGTPADDPVVQRARDYLLKTQLADGSWLVTSRVKNKAQPYFENGDPHGEHQFISTAATSWAAAALAQLLPAKTEAKAP
jgi:hypothetical protein